jgi:hypothetical protein
LDVQHPRTRQNCLSKLWYSTLAINGK